MWHPEVGEIQVMCIKGLPTVDPDVGDMLIWELEQAVLTFQLTGECAYTRKYPGGIVGISPPIQDPTPEALSLMDQEEEEPLSDLDLFTP